MQGQSRRGNSSAEDWIIAAVYNRMQHNMVNCLGGSCDRCAHREKYGSGKKEVFQASIRAVLYSHDRIYPDSER